MAARIAPTAEPAFDPALSPELFPAFPVADASAGEALMDVFAGEALVGVMAGEALVVFEREIAAEGNAVPRLVCAAPLVLVGVLNPATVTKFSATLPVVIPLRVPQPQNSVASLSHSNLKAEGWSGSLHECKLRS